MKLQHLWLRCLSLVLISASCTTSVPNVDELWNNPISTPPFIHDLPTGQFGQGNSEFDMCLGIDESVLFEPGDSAESISRHIQETLRLSVDGQSVDTIFYSYLLLLGVYDSEGNYLGSHGGIDEVCFNLPRQDNGLYLANVRVESTSGKEFAHTWAIKIG